MVQQSPPETFPRMLTRVETAKVLAVTPRCLARWAEEGRGPPFIRLTDTTQAVRTRKGSADSTRLRRNGPVRYPEAELRQWMANRLQLSTSS